MHLCGNCIVRFVSLLGTSSKPHTKVGHKIEPGIGPLLQIVRNVKHEDFDSKFKDHNLICTSY